MHKTSIFAVVLAALPSFAFAVDMTPEQVEKTLKNNNMAAMIPLYTKGALVLDTQNTTVNLMRLVSKRGAYVDGEAAEAKYWYRGMPAAEANTFVVGNFAAINWKLDSYVGIAPKYTYSKNYLKANNPGAVIEFGTDKVGWLYDQWSVQHSCTIKAEGGGTYGLGFTGSTQSCNVGVRHFNPTIQGLGQIFNPWLANNTVTAKVVYVLGDRNK